jgi:transcriptional regulator with XRE-family HTH domain
MEWDMNLKELSHRVAKTRKQLGLSQEGLAKRAHMSRNYISLIERGIATNVTATMIGNLASALNTTPAELWGEVVPNEVIITLPLRQFAIEEGLRYDIIDRLARIPRPGQEPTTLDEWREIYKVVRPYVDEKAI